MKKKYLLLIVLLVVLIVCGYFGYKVYVLNKYNVDDIVVQEEYKTFLNALINHDTTTINLVGKQTDSDYITLGAMNIKDDFEKIVRSDTSNATDDTFKSEQYIIYDENDTQIAGLGLGTTPTFVDIIKDDLTFFGSEKKSELGTSESRAKFLEEKNIKTDLDLFDYLIKTHDQEYNIFSNTNEIKNNYRLHYILSITVAGEELIYIKGDIEVI